MKKKIILIIYVVISGIIFYSSASPKKATAADEIAFPDDYRSWTHIKTAVNNPSFATHSGFHHIYANPEAMEGYKTGKFPDGAIIVFDVLESVTQKNGNVTEGKRKLVDVMVKDSAKYKETGGWGYEEFIYGESGGKTKLHPTKAQCADCHATQKDNGFVFSKYRE